MTEPTVSLRAALEQARDDINSLPFINREGRLVRARRDAIARIDAALAQPAPPTEAAPLRNGLRGNVVRRFNSERGVYEYVTRPALTSEVQTADRFAEGRIAALESDEAFLHHLDRINRVAEAMMDDPFTDDERLSGTTQQMSRCQHYATTAIRTLANGEPT